MKYLLFSDQEVGFFYLLSTLLKLYDYTVSSFGAVIIMIDIS